jgi:hypothetical protein
MEYGGHVPSTITVYPPKNRTVLTGAHAIDVSLAGLRHCIACRKCNLLIVAGDVLLGSGSTDRVTAAVSGRSREQGRAGR